MRGIESTAMLLAASDGGVADNEKVELLSVPDSVPNGELISFEGKEPSEPDAHTQRAKGAVKVWDRVKVQLKDQREWRSNVREEKSSSSHDDELQDQ